MSKKKMTRREACEVIYGNKHPAAKSTTVRSHAVLKFHTGGSDGGVRRPGKTLADRTNGSWQSKAERNANQARYRGGN